MISLLAPRRSSPSVSPANQQPNLCNEDIIHCNKQDLRVAGLISEAAMGEGKVGGREDEGSQQQRRKPPWSVKLEVGGAAGVLLLGGALLVGAVAVAWKARRARVHKEVEKEKEENTASTQDLDHIHSDVNDTQENGSGHQTEEDDSKYQVQVDEENSPMQNEESEAEPRKINGEKIGNEASPTESQEEETESSGREEGNRSEEGSDRTGTSSSAFSNSEAVWPTMELNNNNKELPPSDLNLKADESSENEEEDSEGDRNMTAIAAATPKITTGFFPMMALAFANCFIPPPK